LRSGKILRRILRTIATGDVDRLDRTSTLADPGLIDALLAAAKAGSSA
jgi:acetyl-CoA synthetase